MSPFIFFFFFFIIIFFFSSLIAINAARSPSSSPKFTYVNKGRFGSLSAEYGATYRPLPISKPPFQLCFYNTTPNSYTLALGMFAAAAVGGSHPAAPSSVRWVWEANRGKPVGDSAKLVFQQDGNLILTHSDGHVVWQTSTANSTKKVTKLRLSGNGNLILYGKEGNSTGIIWQSFDHPTDTLLMGQALVQDQGPTTLVSRASSRVNLDGHYSLVLEPERVAFHYQGRNSPKLIYDVLFEPDFSHVGFMKLETIKSKKGYDIILRFGADVVEDVRDFYTFASVTYNSHLSFLRLGMDGNFRVFTYNNETGSWNQTFALFSKNQDWESECRLPEKCGSFGLCDQSQCVACPSSPDVGSSNWTKDCKPPKLTTCSKKDEDHIGYYKLEGVTQYMATDWNEFLEFIEEPDCRRNCTANCKCLGYFYNEYRRQCWPTYDLNTLMKLTDTPGRVTYIKYQVK